MHSTSKMGESLKFELGKATRRGIRNCPNCGTVNGTRGIICKNKICRFSFKDRGMMKSTDGNIIAEPELTEAVKIVTGSFLQLYSVHQNGRNDFESWGFVQLPLMQDSDGNPADKTDFDLSIYAITAQCHMPNCFLHLDIANDGNPLNCCSHVKAAVSCGVEANPLFIDKSVFGTIPMPNDVFQNLWTMLENEEVPIVQRVSETMLVIRCTATEQNPLGYLFFVLASNSTKGKTKMLFQCSCCSTKASKDKSYVLCLHFYACVCALASDEELSKQYSSIINLATEHVMTESVNFMPATFEEASEVDVSNVICSIEVDSAEDAFLMLEPDAKKMKSDFNTVNNIVNVEGSSFGDNVLTVLDPSYEDTSQTIGHLITDDRIKNSEMMIDETNVHLTFHEWLANVTEQINQSMHYQFDGKPDPLVFHVPQKFFDCFQQRFSMGSRKKRLPNLMTGFKRKHSQPLGTFTKSTWHINNILQVKQLFDTPMVPLEITRSFVENRDGTYDLYQPPIITPEILQSCNGRQPILPAQLKTYLKVGNTSPNPTEHPVPFIIEWTPNVLPNSQVGELRIKFEFRHSRNGQTDQRRIESRTSLIGPDDLRS